MRKLLLSLAVASVTHAAHADWSETLSKAVSDGEHDVNLRYRLENVDQENTRKTATASTLKTRLTLKTAPINHWQAIIEVDDVSAIGNDNYDSLITDRSQFGNYAVIADPTGTDLNQALLAYNGDNTHFAIGKQRIVHADQRFIGGVAWRQNEQTYDAATLDYKTDDFKLSYSYINRVHRIFDGDGDSIQAKYFSGKSHAFLASTGKLGGTLTLYAYLLDLPEAAALSSSTYGLSYQLKKDAMAFYAAYAKQQDYADNTSNYSANYYKLDASYTLSGTSVGIGTEVLGSDAGNKAFATPLATLHKFQGWADTFLVTPSTGIVDNYLSVTSALGPVKLALIYHDFSADEGNADYGTEVDAVATLPIGKKAKLQFKYADYDADSFAVDTRKFWATVTVNL